MNITELVQAVYTETNRPDLVQETLQAVLEATLSLHTMDSWFKDIIEARVAFDDPTLYIQALDTYALPRYRNMAYVRKNDPVLTQWEQTSGILPQQYRWPPGQFNFLVRKDISVVLDAYGYELNDIWYKSGNQINMKSSTPLKYAMVGWYAFPDLQPATFNSWIANEFPYAIIYRAAGGLYSKIDQDKAAMMYMKPPVPGHGYDTGGLAWQQYGILMRNNIVAGG